MTQRPTWDEYFMSIAALIAMRSTCTRRQVGAIIVKNKNILASGYNGAPARTRHCTDIGCLRENLGVPSGQRHELCRGLHAEQNAIIQAAKNGVSIEGATLFCTTKPCVICSKCLINANIVRIVYEGGYDDKLGMEMLNEAGVKIEQYIKPEKPE